MRSITDSAGTQWTVFEVRKKNRKDQWAYLPSEFGQGWLCFESNTSKRRLTPIPDHWNDSSDAELVQLLGQAQTVKRQSYSADSRPNA